MRRKISRSFSLNDSDARSSAVLGKLSISFCAAKNVHEKWRILHRRHLPSAKNTWASTQCHYTLHTHTSHAKYTQRKWIMKYNGKTVNFLMMPNGERKPNVMRRTKFACILISSRLFVLRGDGRHLLSSKLTLLSVLILVLIIVFFFARLLRRWWWWHIPGVGTRTLRMNCH